MDVKDYFDALFSIAPNEEYAEDKKYQICRDLVEKYKNGAFKNVATEELFMRQQSTIRSSKTLGRPPLEKRANGKTPTRLTTEDIDILTTLFTELVNTQALDIQKQLNFYQTLKQNKREIIKQAEGYTTFLAAKMKELESNSTRLQEVLTKTENISIQEDENKVRLRNESYYFETREFDYRTSRVHLLKQLNHPVLKKVSSISTPTGDLAKLLVIYHKLVLPDRPFAWKEFRAELKKADFLSKIQQLCTKNITSELYDEHHQLFHDDACQNFFLASSQKQEIIHLFQFMSYLFFEFEFCQKKQKLIQYLKSDADAALSKDEEIENLRENIHTLKFKLIELQQIKISEEEKIDQLQGEIAHLSEFIDWLRSELKKNRKFASTALNDLRNYSAKSSTISRSHTNGTDRSSVPSSS